MHLDWQFINSFSGWLSAVGTILAVVVSLYISFSARSTKIGITSGIYVFDEGGQKIRYLRIIIQNVGFRAFYINDSSCISIRVGWLKKRYIGIGRNYIDFTKSSSFPCKVEEGEEANLFVLLHDEKLNWIDGLKKDLLKGSSLASLKFVVFPSIGKSAVGCFSKEVMREFKKT